MGQKKCPHCKKWSAWSQNIEDVCEHCGEKLSHLELARNQKREEERKANEEKWMFYIQKADPPFIVFLKKVGNLFYTVFMAIITFLIWLIAALPG